MGHSRVWWGLGAWRYKHKWKCVPVNDDDDAGDNHITDGRIQICSCRAIAISHSRWLTWWAWAWAWEDGSKDDCPASEQRCPIAKRGYDLPTTRLGSARSTTWPLMVEMMKYESLREKQRRNYRNFHISSEWGWCPRMWINHSLVWWWEDRWWSKCGKLRNWIESLLVQAPIIGGECSNTHLVNFTL